MSRGPQRDSHREGIQMIGDNDHGTVRPIPGEIPEPHREVFKALDEEVSWGHAVWKVYRQLHGTKESIDLLNKVAPAWARIQQDALLDDVLMSLLRITDNEEMKGRQNLVLNCLKPLAAASGEKQIVAEVGAALASVDKACQVLRKHRNRRLAHLDRGIALGEDTLPGFTLEQIDVAFTMVREAMNALNCYFRGGPTIYDEVGLQGDGRLLLSALQDALRLRELRRREGEMTEEQLRFAIQARGLKGEDLLGSGG